MLRSIRIVGFQGSFCAVVYNLSLWLLILFFLQINLHKKCEWFISKSIEPFNSRAVFELDHGCCMFFFLKEIPIFLQINLHKKCEWFISKSIEPFNSRAVFELDHGCCILFFFWKRYLKADPWSLRCRTQGSNPPGRPLKFKARTQGSNPGWVPHPRFESWAGASRQVVFATVPWAPWLVVVYLYWG